MDLTPLPEQECTGKEGKGKEGEGGEESEGEEDDEEAEEAMGDSDEEEEDDTADRMEECGEAPETPPAGFVYAPCPPLATEEDQRNLCGRRRGSNRGRDAHCGLHEGADEDEGARRSRGVQAQRRQLRGRGVVAAARPGRAVKLVRRGGGACTQSTYVRAVTV